MFIYSNNVNISMKVCSSKINYAYFVINQGFSRNNLAGCAAIWAYLFVIFIKMNWFFVNSLLILLFSKEEYFTFP